MGWVTSGIAIIVFIASTIKHKFGSAVVEILAWLTADWDNTLHNVSAMWLIVSFELI